ncbi:MAG: trypsin-like peptidase domain-containing protein, partial [Candidatus Kapabacteria bacterium]|nr:trypsin-like peptidase domain-containing protein [Candidatus Kapabacteria bacterium]MDW7997353.1 trypsin-like peptidase domain-containing protein [Bacteroidota bacterium]
EYRRRYTIRNLGSGFITSPDGYVVTNHHVVGDNPTRITVTLVGGEHHNAELVGADPVSDIALLRLRPEKARRFPYVPLGNSDSIVVGEWVIAFGNPFGLFDINAKPTVTVGVVSNVGVNFRQEGRVYRGMIQTDAAISSGNSGGPLVNALGEVVGVNAAIISTAQSWQGAGSIGIGFAIPINRVKHVIERLRTDGKIERDIDIGIRLSDPEQYELGKGQRGALIVSVRRGSPADRAGLEPGDLIVAIDGTRVQDTKDADLLLTDSFVGQRLRITILRGGKEFTTELTVGKRRP